MVSDAKNTTIGGLDTTTDATTPGARNVISGNTGNGVVIQGAGDGKHGPRQLHRHDAGRDSAAANTVDGARIVGAPRRP